MPTLSSSMCARYLSSFRNNFISFFVVVVYKITSSHEEKLENTNEQNEENKI